MTTSQSDRLDKLEAALEANTEAIKQLGEQVSSWQLLLLNSRKTSKGGQRGCALPQRLFCLALP